ncbi:fumarylacetoacetase [Nakamurella multipartita]|uniref:fumarylacetoacetase n=1 Tax=Nakamurella multipartita (strain ATCC 700099 / DSM 44233 / CIP 104796 / JCM 9543 / NBRC 105858 / Y-104) TaxID=479431 RepID=C8X778_NAKMY|nr:fumarylacetoacetase [Nakamurella multipartita]ACV76947.1 fumarylacetoacetase [Nakamurella multipartita DSM 44233]
MASWVPGAAGSGFDDDHLPYGVFDAGAGRRVGVRIGSSVLDLAAVADTPELAGVLAAGSLDPLLAAGPATWAAARSLAHRAVTDPDCRTLVESHLHPLESVRLLLPFTVADYVDFYASQWHATAVGRMFRPDADPLPPNWKHLPIGYHGRAGSVVVSGTPVSRPRGQTRLPGAAPTFGPTQRLDLEAEVAFVVGVGSPLGSPVPAGAFARHVFGVGLLNDWSARDIQAWEYRPLGPMLGKSFATSVGPWITPLAALAAARVAPPPRTHRLLPYLADDAGLPWGLDLALTVEVNGTVVSRPPFAAMYWTGPQLIAHLTSNGARLRTGDLLASGTVSGPAADQAGSLLELSANGTRPVPLGDGTSRTFLADGDVVTITATAPSTGGGRLTLGEVTGAVRPAAG